jgi:acyl carrier protein
MLAGLSPSSAAVAESDDGEALTAHILASAPEQRCELAQTHLRRVLAGVLGTSPERLDVERPLAELGIDSLMAVEIMSRLQADVGIEIPPAKLMEGTSLAGLASFLVDELTAANATTVGVES